MVSSITEPNTVVRAGITLTKTLEVEEFVIPAVVYEFDSDRDREVQARIVQELPAFISPELLKFHGEYGSQQWVLNEHEAIFEAEIPPDETILTVLGMTVDDNDPLLAIFDADVELSVSSPREAVQDSPARDEAQARADAEERTSERRADSSWFMWEEASIPQSIETVFGPTSEQADSTQQFTRSASSSPDSDSSPEPAALRANADGAPGRANPTDSPPETGVDDGSAVGIDAGADGGSDAGAESGPAAGPDGGSDAETEAGTAAETLESDRTGLGEDSPDRSSGSESVDPPTSGARSAQLGNSLRDLLTAVSEGEVTEEELRTLRGIFSDESPDRERMEARIRHLQTQMADLQAYTDALEEFLAENGSANRILTRFENRTAELSEEVTRLDATVEGNEDDIRALHEEVTHLTEEVESFRTVHEDVRTGLDDLQDTVADIDRRVPDEDLEDRFATLENELAEIREWKENMRQIFS